MSKTENREPVPGARPARRGLRLAFVLVFGLATLGTCLAFGQEVGLGSLRAVIAREYPEIAWIGVDELASAMRRAPGARPRLVDARTPAEFAVSHLAGAVRIDPDHPDVGSLAVPRDASIVVYCSVGYRSARVARALRTAGFTDVRNLETGIFGWANQGLPVMRGRRVVRDVHPYDDAWGRLLAAPLRTRTPRS